MAHPQSVSRRLIVADDVATVAAEHVVTRQPRTLALAGGSTPRALYEQLAGSNLAWADMEVFFTDERCVPPDDRDSNFRMANEALLSKVNANVHRMPGERCDAGEYETEMRDVFGAAPVFDLVLLGLGADGHTASLFPGDTALEEDQRWVVAVRRPDHERLTLTLAVLSAARTAIFLVTGTTKRDALRRLLAGEDIPAARVHAGEVLIIADKAAAQGASG
ncbi:MAG: 6-phosphogluconolactonase [Chloroflexi bacterium]|nr:6-phosphogluconolactonase [Chloroflexota bacterium]